MKGRIFLSLFALPFAGVGVWAGWSIGSTIHDAVAMRDWVPVEARLVSAGYETHSGDDSDTYEAYAEYRYSVGGRDYVGHRVSTSSGADNIGDYQVDLGNRLSRALGRGEPVTVFVNPGDPAQSIVDREIRWGLIGFKAIFLLLFGGAGFGMLALAWLKSKKSDTPPSELERAPWLANDDWQSATIRSGSKAAMWGAWFFAVLWNLISSVTPFIAYGEVVEKGNYAALLALVFPLVGIGLLVWAIRRTLEWRRFGPVPVTLDPFPGSIGGHVGGTVDLGVPFDPSLRVEATLTSLESYVSGSGKNRSRRERAKWQDARLAHAEPGGRGTRLVFRFDVPAGLTESDAAKDEDRYHLWRLNLSAELPGADLDRDYEIPVYATATASRTLPDRALEKAGDELATRNAQRIRDVFRFEQSAAGKRMFYPAGRHLGGSLGGFAIGGIFAAAGLFLFRSGESAVFASVFGGVGALIAVACLYAMLNSLEVRQQGTGIVTVRRWLGIPIRRRQLARHDVVRLDSSSSLQSQSGNKHVVHYSVHAVDREGNKIHLGEGFKGSSEADAAIAFIAREFGLPAPPTRETEPVDTVGDDVLTADR